MAVKLRLQRKGRKKAPFYHIVAADARAKRDGRYIERIGTYNPLTVPATINLHHDRAFYWLMQGAQPTDTVRAILGFRGVLYRKHLQVGVNKGALTQEEADKKYQDWLAAKDSKIAERRQASADADFARQRQIDGVAKVAPKKEEVVSVEETVAAPVVEETAAVEEAVAAPVVEETPAAEEVVAEPVVEEASAVETVVETEVEVVKGVDEELAGLEETTPEA